MRLTNIGDLATDEKLSQDGVPLDLGEGRVLWVRRAGGHNREFAYVLARNLAAQDESYASMSAEARAALELRVFSECMVSRWQGFETDDGEAPCTPDLVRDLFESAPDVYEKVREKAADEEAYRLPADTKSLQ